MNDRLWKIFENTGSIDAYLMYKYTGHKEDKSYHGKTAGDGDSSFSYSHRRV